MGKAFFIINPTSGRGKAANGWPQIREIFRTANWHFDFAFTQRRVEAVEIARQAASGGFETIVPIGGDGTIHEVVNGLFAEGRAINPDITLGIIPGGTGNDLARALGLPSETLPAAQRLASSQQTHRIDLGEATVSAAGESRRRLFINDADIGFAATVVERLERTGKFSRGSAPYFAALLLSALRHRNHPVKLQVGDQITESELTTVLICNGQSTGGGMLVAPNAIVDDGLFDVVSVGALSRPGIFWHAPKIYRGTHLKLRQVSVQRAGQVTLSSATRLPIATDGEFIGVAPASFRILPAAIKVRV